MFDSIKDRALKSVAKIGLLSKASGIFAAAESGSIETLTFLVDEKGADVNARDAQDRTPLHLAAMNGHLSAARFLIERGAHVNARAGEGQLAPLGLLVWAMKNRPEMARLLIEKDADVNERTGDGMPLLHGACGGGMIEIVKVLIEKGADVNIRDARGCTPLHCVALARKTAIVKLLIAEGADINAKGVGGVMPLHTALLGEDSEIAKLLVENGADVNAAFRDELTGSGRSATPIELASELGLTEMVKVLRKAGAGGGGST